MVLKLGFLGQVFGVLSRRFLTRVKTGQQDSCFAGSGDLAERDFRAPPTEGVFMIPVDLLRESAFRLVADPLRGLRRGLYVNLNKQNPEQRVFGADKKAGCPGSGLWNWLLQRLVG